MMYIRMHHEYRARWPKKYFLDVIVHIAQITKAGKVLKLIECLKDEIVLK